ncbi:DUF7673 family protein [Marinobacter xestospongiae]|uniref:DUF7673 family protein n=1 Tax=Marinobacter xestospongiae TaxID=994319 RepID=UPI002004AC93|nr:hypothetical protein [Marinobacter xestospongiae]MCK7568786.1 hypothetical protein [Marinobacter xestospongiae]
MITINASANDIERALAELYRLATTGTDSNARHAGSFLLALWNGDQHPLNVTEFKYLEPKPMRQAVQLFAFLMTTGTSLHNFMSEEAIAQVAENVSAATGETFNNTLKRHPNGAHHARPAATPAPECRTLP